MTPAGKKALAYCTSPTELCGLTSSIARLLEQSGRVEEALTLHRADADVPAWEVAELLIKQGRTAEAITNMPATSELHEVSRHRDATRRAAHSPNDPPS